MNRTTQYRHPSSLLKKSCLSVLVAFALSATVQAQQGAQPLQFSVQAGDLVQVVNEISRNSGVQIVYDIDLLRGLKAGEVKGALTVGQALDRALAGSGLRWTRVGAATIKIENAAVKKSASRKPAASKAKDGETEPDGNAPRDMDNVVVVGSRLGGSPVESAMPIKVITREQIDRSGASGIAQLMTYLTEVPINNTGDTSIATTAGFGGGGNEINATNVQLRGLPLGTTLVLINGRRAGESSAFMRSGQFDLSSIPLSFIERIEVLPSGASAVYGGDGLAGVVNIVLRQDVSGVEVNVRKMAADGYQEDHAGLAWGRTWSSGRLMAALAWKKKGELTTDEREITADRDYARFGGRDRTSASGYPAAFYSLDGCPPYPKFCNVPMDKRKNLPGLDSSFVTVPAGLDGKGVTIPSLSAGSGVMRKYSPKSNLFSPEETSSLNISGEVDVAADTRLFFEAMYNKRRVPAKEAGFQAGVSTNGTMILGRANPYNPFGEDVGIILLVPNTGVYQNYSQEARRVALGMRGMISGWDWEVAASQNDDASRYSGIGPVFNNAAIQAALLSSDPAVAINPFISDGGVPWSQEQLSNLLNPLKENRFTSMGRNVTAFASGDLVKLPAGQLRALVGAEYEYSRYKSSVERMASNGDDGHAMFAEVRAPVLKGGQGQWDGLVLTSALRRQASGRHDGAAFTKTFGVEYRPASTLYARFAYSTAFKPIPAFAAALHSTTGTITTRDPKFGNAMVPYTYFLGGGAPAGLRPESSTSRSIGITYNPGTSWGVTLNVWENQVWDRLASIPVETMLALEESYQDRIVRDKTTGALVSIDQRIGNIAYSDTRGMDLLADASIDVGRATMNVSVAATYTAKYDGKLLPTQPIKSSLATYDPVGWAPRWKIVPRVEWATSDNLHATLTGRYISKYMDTDKLADGRNQQLGDFWIIDANLDVSLRRWLRSDAIARHDPRIIFGVANLFNRLPDFCNACGGYDASQYDILGRRVYAEVRFSF